MRVASYDEEPVPVAFMVACHTFISRDSRVEEGLREGGVGVKPNVTLTAPCSSDFQLPEGGVTLLILLAILSVIFKTKMSFSDITPAAESVGWQRVSQYGLF